MYLLGMRQVPTAWAAIPRADPQPSTYLLLYLRKFPTTLPADISYYSTHETPFWMFYLSFIQKAHVSSSSRKLAKKLANSCFDVRMSVTPTVSRMECIEREGTPTSAVRRPTRAAMIGPMVVPHGQSLRTTNSCSGGGSEGGRQAFVSSHTTSEQWHASVQIHSSVGS